MFLALVAAGQAGVLEDAVRARVAEALALPAADVDVQPVGRLAGLPEEGPCVVRLPGVGPLEGVLPVTLTCGEGRWATRVEVTTWRTVPVALAEVQAGGSVSVGTARVASSRLRGEPPVSGAGPWRARVDLEAGAPLTTVRVEPMPAAVRGAAVTLVAAAGPLTVKAPGELLGDAFLDAPVSVLNRSTRSVVQGRYQGDGIVAVEVP